MNKFKREIIMRKTVKKLMNVYVISWLIAIFSFLYLLSFAFIDSSISKGSSVAIKKAMLEKERLQKQ